MSKSCIMIYIKDRRSNSWLINWNLLVLFSNQLLWLIETPRWIDDQKWTYVPISCVCSELWFVSINSPVKMGKNSKIEKWTQSQYLKVSHKIELSKNIYES